MKTTITLFLCLWMGFILSGCETVKGMGQDLENTGENIQEAAQKLEKNNAEEEPAK